jgi:hypothetical protein
LGNPTKPMIFRYQVGWVEALGNPTKPMIFRYQVGWVEALGNPTKPVIFSIGLTQRNPTYTNSFYLLPFKSWKDQLYI